jgi:hypothetical protein
MPTVNNIQTWLPLMNASRALNGSARAWFICATAGLWLFSFYVALVFGSLLWQQGLSGLAQSHLANGFMDGDRIGNPAVALHVLLAVLLMAGGPLQLIPAVRAHWPAFHRWLGRSYLTAALLSSIAGLYLIWTRPLFGSWLSNVGTSADGVLIIACAIVALRHALARNFIAHRRWALRLFMVVNGVWFLRVGLNVWLMFTGGAGIDFKTFSGPFIDFNAFAQFLLPLAVFELYLRARERGSAGMKLGVAILIVVLTVLMVLGIYGAATRMWLPRL